MIASATLERLTDALPQQPAALGDLDVLRSRALAQHPAIRSAELARQALEARARLARRDIVPDPTIGLGSPSEPANPPMPDHTRQRKKRS